MKFLADMGISPRSVAFLRDLGYEAVHLYELKLDRLPDAETPTEKDNATDRESA